MIETIILLVVLYLVPGLVFFFLARSKHTSKMRFGIHLLFAFSLTLFLFIWGQYAILGSHYFRYLLPILFILTGFLAFQGSYFDAPKVPIKIFKKITGLAMILAALGALSLSFLGLSGFGTQEEVIKLALPFEEGRWYVGSGGTSKVINLHYREETPFQMLGVDFHPLNDFLSSKSSILGTKNEDFVGFGKAVTSPCSGTVNSVRNDVPDNPPGEFLPDIPGSGNRVILSCNGALISMYHFQEGSIKVLEGNAVETGDYIGNIGNSGFTTDPHLHIHASIEDESVSGGEKGIPIIFDGQFLVRNDIAEK